MSEGETTMNDDADRLHEVLDHGAPEVIWPVPENATIRPGSGRSLWDGLSITHWSDDA
jgi:hypothetical protein